MAENLTPINEYVSALPVAADLSTVVGYGINGSAQSVKYSLAPIMQAFNSLNTLLSVVNGHTTSISALQQRMSDAEGDIGDNATAIAANTTAIAANTSAIDAVNTTLNTLDGRISANTSQLGTISNNITAVNSRLDTVNTELDTLDDTVTALQENVALALRQTDDLASETVSGGTVLLYVGDTTADFTYGNFYRYDSEDEAWTLVNGGVVVASGDSFLSVSNNELSSAIDIAYNSTNQHLELKGVGGTVVSYVDMATFVKDGMLESVELITTPESGISVETPYLKFTFNTDSGKSVIRVSLHSLVDVFDGSNINLTNAFAKAATYTAPAIGDSMDTAISKLLKGHEDNAAAILTKQDKLTFDTTPTANSTKPVTSGGLYNELRITATAVPQDVDWTTLQMVNNDSYYRILPGSYAGKFVRLVNLPTDNMPIIYMLKSEWAASPSKVAYICSANRAMGIRSFYNQTMTIAVFQDSLRKYTINTEFTENDVDYIGPLEAESFTPSTTYSLKQFVEVLNSSQEDMQVIIDGKENTITGAASTITASNLTASKVLVSDSSGKVAASAVTSTELGYLSGVTSSVQTQLNNKATSTQGGYADSALQTVTASGSGYVTLTASDKLGDNGAKSQTLSAALTMQAIDTADSSHMGLAEASDVKNALENAGIIWTEL